MIELQKDEQNHSQAIFRMCKAVRNFMVRLHETYVLFFSFFRNLHTIVQIASATSYARHRDKTSERIASFSAPKGIWHNSWTPINATEVQAVVLSTSGASFACFFCKFRFCLKSETWHALQRCAGTEKVLEMTLSYKQTASQLTMHKNEWNRLGSGEWAS